MGGGKAAETAIDILQICMFCHIDDVYIYMFAKKVHFLKKNGVQSIFYGYNGKRKPYGIDARTEDGYTKAPTHMANYLMLTIAMVCVQCSHVRDKQYVYSYEWRINVNTRCVFQQFAPTFSKEVIA